nr:hypothetical protein Iba_chr05cCG11700 [Ipomoea batatas]
MPPRPRKKSIAQKPAPAAQPKTTPLHDLKNFERYKFFSERRVFQPYILSLDVAEYFGIRDEVEEMVSLPVWRYLLMDFQEDTYTSVLVEVMTTMKLPKFDGLTCSPCMQFYVGHTMFKFSPDDISELMGFGPIQQLTEEERDNRVTNVGNTQAFWEELTDATRVVGGTMPPAPSTTLTGYVSMAWSSACDFIWEWSSGTSSRISINHGEWLCTWPLAAEAVERMRDKIGAKRARTAATTDVRIEEEAYDAHPDAAGPAHVGAGKGSSSGDFHQQVLAQLAVMNMKVIHIYTRIDAMEAANAQSREEAHAYYEWIRGHYPPPGGP